MQFCGYYSHSGVENSKELTNGLFTDHYCHVCDAVLHFNYHRLSHYEVCVAVKEFVMTLKQKSYSDHLFRLPPSSPNQGKKHAQKVKAYLWKKTAEKMKREAGGTKVGFCIDISHSFMSKSCEINTFWGF